MIKIKIFFVLLLLMASCSPVKRHQRLVEKYPHVHQQDTLIMRDTIRIEIPKEKIDTVFLTKNLVDTITVINDILKIKMYAVHDSIYVSGECYTITVEKIIERKIPIRYYEKNPSWLKHAKNWLWIFLVFLLTVLLIYRITRK